MQHPLLRSARALMTTSAGCMGLDVHKTRLVIICSAPKSAWEFSQEVKVIIKRDSELHVIIVNLICEPSDGTGR